LLRRWLTDWIITRQLTTILPEAVEATYRLFPDQLEGGICGQRGHYEKLNDLHW